MGPLAIPPTEKHTQTIPENFPFRQRLTKVIPARESTDKIIGHLNKLLSQGHITLASYIRGGLNKASEDEAKGHEASPAPATQPQMKSSTPAPRLALED